MPNTKSQKPQINKKIENKTRSLFVFVLEQNFLEILRFKNENINSKKTTKNKLHTEQTLGCGVRNFQKFCTSPGEKTQNTKLKKPKKDPKHHK